MNSVTRTHYLVYKITNKINSKTYIGCHKTKNPNDDYMGSGKILRLAKLKYGLENFDKEILFDFYTSEEMFAKEKLIIADLKPEYNVHAGGLGGWDYVNSKRTLQQSILYGKMATLKSKEYGAAIRNGNIKEYMSNPKLCITCNKILEYDKRVNSFCSRKCYSYTPRWNSGGHLSECTREKISNGLRKFYGQKRERFCSCGKNINLTNKTGLCISCFRGTQYDKIDIELAKKMRSVDQMTYQQIAKFFGVSHPTIMSKIKQ